MTPPLSGPPEANCLGWVERVRFDGDWQALERRRLRQRRPVIVTGALDDWGAMRLWDCEHLKRKVGDRTVKVAAVNADNRTDHDYDRHTPIRFRDFVDGMQSGSLDRKYLVICNILVAERERWRRFPEAQLPELGDDLELPAFIPRARLAEANLWMGFGDEITHLHYDILDNLLAVFRGKKELVLFEPDQSRYLYSQRVSADPANSLVDVARPDYGAFPGFRRARYWRCELRAGEALFLPAGTWHYVRSEGLTLAVNFWWYPLRVVNYLRFLGEPRRKSLASLVLHAGVNRVKRLARRPRAA